MTGSESHDKKPASAGFSLVKRFSVNTIGRDLIVGDIHGQFARLERALDAIGFSPEAGDRLFSVGDLVDRGPESDRALEWLSRPWFHAVRGNHEQMAIDFAAGRIASAQMYMMNGGGWNLCNPPEAAREFGEAFSALPVAIELETERGLVGIIHADCPVLSWDETCRRLRASTRPDDDAFVQTCLWSRSRVQNDCDDEVSGVRAIVVGHTPLPFATWFGNVVHIDTGAWHDERKEFGIMDAATLMRAETVSRLKAPSH